jgi:hypothetical protein
MMSQTENPRQLLRSIGAVLAGLLFIFIVSIGTDVVMHATEIFPPWFQPMSGPLWMFALAYRCVYAVIGCFITARLAPNRPMKHALLLGIIGTFLSILGVVGSWNAGPEFGPKWYPISLVISSIPCAWIGGKLGERRKGKRGKRGIDHGVARG